MGIRSYTKYQEPIYKRPFLNYKYNRQIKNTFQEIIADIVPDIITTMIGEEYKFILEIKTESKIIMESHTAKQYRRQIDMVGRSLVFQIYKRWKVREAFREIKKIEDKCDAIVALTNGDTKEWKAKKVVTIPNIVDLHNQKYSSLTNKVALFAGRFSKEKGLDAMLEVWKIVVSNRNDWTLRLVGEGDPKDKLIKQCKLLGIEKNVLFVEPTRNIAEEYCNASLFLLTSRYEGFGLVLVEAMQCGVPCISFDCPYGPSDIINNGENGIIVENGNIEEFANAVLRLMDDEELRQSMGKAAMEKSKMYLPEIIMPQWIDLYNKLT